MSVVSGVWRAVAAVASVVLLLLIVAVFWYFFWTYALAPNPLIREFFDLDRKSGPVEDKREQKKIK
jgi:hypothetical protein